MSEKFVIGVDVGTGSVRAALIATSGEHKRIATHNIQTWNPRPGYFHQSSDDIWSSCCKVIKEVVKDVEAQSIVGLGFDATCSLVVLDEKQKPLTISLSGEADQNVILWMDHRAEKEAEDVNQTSHPVLKSVGGKISLEMQVPKLLWIKKNLPDTWKRASLFFDLPDFLTWKATGAESRSLCSVVCKWTYDASKEGVKGWNKEFFSKVGLSDLIENNFMKIGQDVLAPGSRCGSGLSVVPAEQMGLCLGTPVATSIIDAHAGGLGLIGCTAPNIPTDFCSRLALICGTSTCHMAVSRDAVFVPGVWGPYLSAMVPGLWLNEGGQSATGRLLDHVVNSHPAATSLRLSIHPDQVWHLSDQLAVLLDKLAVDAGLSSVDELTQDLHVWPDYHGNRSPLADSTLRGMVSGLSLSTDKKDLALLYLATVQALAYGTRHILEQLEGNGHERFDCLLVCGGLTKHALYVRAQASVVGRPVLVPRHTNAVLTGAAVLAACAAGVYPSVQHAVTAMAGPADIVYPNQNVVPYHQRKYEVFLRMVKDQKAYKEIMNSL